MTESGGADTFNPFSSIPVIQCATATGSNYAQFTLNHDTGCIYVLHNYSTDTPTLTVDGASKSLSTVGVPVGEAYNSHGLCIRKWTGNALSGSVVKVRSSIGVSQAGVAVIG